jgi:hypothetical protein
MVTEARPTLYVQKEMDELTKWMEFIMEILTVSISAYSITITSSFLLRVTKHEGREAAALTT